MSTLELVALVCASIGLGKLLELGLAKVLNRRIDTVSEEKVKVETAKAAADTARTEVETIREVLEEVREHSATKDKRIDKLESDVDFLRTAVTELQERERHQLTRAAAHESWDQMSFALLVKHFPDHPAPPPLTPAHDDPHAPPDALPYVTIDEGTQP
jgi:hypothetical protein